MASQCSASPRRRSHAASIRRTSHVVLFHGQGCSLCDRARAQLQRLRTELDFAYEEIDITDVDELEQAYREWLPVVEIDGKRAFVYYLDEPAFRRKLAAESETREPG
jgi:glutaredoxin